MDTVRELLGYLLGVAFCIGGLVLCGIAWMGLQNEFGWQLALAGVVVSILVRVNFPLVVGLFLYAHNLWGWSQAESIAFAVPGLLLLLPSIATEVFSVLVGATQRR
ncbi:MAG: hypothetical protein DCF31_12075 [Alphaproteobacteria bacterium]|nr:MAG: hypothetical protein DCF31_12075 [Alphaproteobacteria bacterium]